MRFITFFASLLIAVSSYAQHYHWDWALGSGTCRLFAQSYFNIYDNTTVPLDMEVDANGNLYVLGEFPILDGIWERKYNVGDVSIMGQNKKVPESMTGNTALYLYCVSNSGQLNWLKFISGSFVNEIDKASLTVNPINGKCYIKARAANEVQIDQDVYNTNANKLSFIPAKMLICLNQNGSYNNTMFTVGYLDQPHFVSSSTGIFSGSYVSPFDPYTDSVSIFTFDANADTILYRKTLNFERIAAYDPRNYTFYSYTMKSYDFDFNLIGIPPVGFTQGWIPVNYENVNVQIDNKQNVYVSYQNQVNDPFDKFFLRKYDKKINLKWYNTLGTGFSVDSGGNLWTIGQHLNLYRVNGGAYVKCIGDYNNPSPYFIADIDTSTGYIGNKRIIPTNMYNQSFLFGQFKMDRFNRFWISGQMMSELEFGNKTISMNCQSGNLPLQHYVARAVEGWEQNRKNLSVDGVTELNLGVYPIPCSSELHLTGFDQIKDIEFKVFDQLGQELSIVYDAESKIFNTQDLSTGVYLLSISYNGKQEFIKFIKS